MGNNILTYRTWAPRDATEPFKAWLEKQTLIALPKSPLGKAVSYTLNQMLDFTALSKHASFMATNRMRIWKLLLKSCPWLKRLKIMNRCCRGVLM